MDCSGTPSLCPQLQAIQFPILTKERFAEMSGLEVGVVRGMLDRGYLPGVKIGRHRLVNLAALQARCLGGENPPSPSR